MRDSSIVPVTGDKNNEPLNVGRKHRAVTPPLKRALISRDKSFRYPGCAHDKWLDAHHVMHWVDGGETSLANTMLLCGKHHRLLHEGGFAIRKNFKDKWSFRTESGRVIPDSPIVSVNYYDDTSGRPSGVMGLRLITMLILSGSWFPCILWNPL
jgi:hypothetical protein